MMACDKSRASSSTSLSGERADNEVEEEALLLSQAIIS